MFIYRRLILVANYVEEKIGPVPEVWWKLEPSEFDYAAYEPNLVAARFKASDVVACFSLARLLLIESASLNNHVMRKDARIFYKASLLQSSLMHYISSWDLSWQVYWFKYIVRPNKKIVIMERYYDKLSSKCNYRDLKEKLEGKGQTSVIEYLQSYNKDEFWKSLRKSYNYIKHSGAYHMRGVGINPRKGIFSINGKRPFLISRHDFDVDEWTDKLIRYNNEFVSYFNNVIQEVSYDKAVMEFKSGSSNDETLEMIRKLKNYT